MMPNPQDESAPTPWLSGSLPAGTLTAAQQPWSSSSDSLVISYALVKREFFQRLMRHSQRNARRSLLLNLAIGFLVGVLPLATIVAVVNYVPGTHAPPVSIWRLFVLFWIGATLLTPVVFFLFSLLLFALVAQITEWTAKGKPVTVTLASGGAKREFDFTERVSWQEVRSVEAWEGGIIIVARSGRPQIGVPESAFRDADAAERFAEAAKMLWESHGDMSLVPEETRTRFAPTTEKIIAQTKSA